jgi:hypothetical protein
MATTTPTNAGALVVALDQIHVPGNVRALDQAHVDALAGSIALQGLLVPVIVAAATDELAAEGWRYQLIAGFHRYAAVAKLGRAIVEGRRINAIVSVAGGWVCWFWFRHARRWHSRLEIARCSMQRAWSHERRH